MQATRPISPVSYTHLDVYKRQVLKGFRVSLWGKDVEGASYNMENAVEAAFPDGVQIVDGVVSYTNGTGVPFTGWGWNDKDRYYFVDNAPVTGWQYIDGFKYYFEDVYKRQRFSPFSC